MSRGVSPCPGPSPPAAGRGERGVKNGDPKAHLARALQGEARPHSPPGWPPLRLGSWEAPWPSLPTPKC